MHFVSGAHPPLPSTLYSTLPYPALSCPGPFHHMQDTRMNRKELASDETTAIGNDGAGGEGGGGGVHTHVSSCFLAVQLPTPKPSSSRLR
jgi:hypothetical protein